ncbi:LPXTG cell wall anchor domain-containing protein [Kitasatospora sp. NBC_00240]|uniref:LAETG motif-containing sortase-dependent surface protein n=1 Tax=Kitasatospora sp. NBC_00240 TaxID=2903567 RepID=UPI002251663D|nr:LAETG motif-containing sortase-dependent surface protein [Kitasatospora sp. NBC_00240]MCX5210311.1 LPXTG cell wall anchor domain-containing protein [Kitasatospora sp. NBC_00240]
MARHVRIRGAALAAAAGTAVLLSGVLATGASAHTPAWSVTCDKVTVDLADYSGSKNVKNLVSLTIDGEKVVDQHQFGSGYHQSFTVKAHSAPVMATLVVTTTEQPKNPQWNVTETKTIAVCATPSPTPTTPTTPPTPSTSPTPTRTATATPSGSASPTVAPTSTTTSAAPATSAPATSAPATVKAASTTPALAQTGGSSATPIVAAAGGAVVLIGGALLLLSRRRGNRH